MTENPVIITAFIIRLNKSCSYSIYEEDRAYNFLHFFFLEFRVIFENAFIVIGHCLTALTRYDRWRYVLRCFNNRRWKYIRHLRCYVNQILWPIIAFTPIHSRVQNISVPKRANV